MKSHFLIEKRCSYPSNILRQHNELLAIDIIREKAKEYGEEELSTLLHCLWDIESPESLLYIFPLSSKNEMVIKRYFPNIDKEKFDKVIKDIDSIYKELIKITPRQIAMYMNAVRRRERFQDAFDYYSDVVIDVIKPMGLFVNPEIEGIELLTNGKSKSKDEAGMERMIKIEQSMALNQKSIKELEKDYEEYMASKRRETKQQGNDIAGAGANLEGFVADESM